MSTSISEFSKALTVWRGKSAIKNVKKKVSGSSQQKLSHDKNAAKVVLLFTSKENKLITKAAKKTLYYSIQIVV